METANIITINTDDKNLAEVIKKVIADAGLTIADLFDDDEVCDHIHESGMPVDVVYDEDDILGCGCVTDKIEELEDQLGELQEANAETEHDNEILKKKWRKLEKELAELKKKLPEEIPPIPHVKLDPAISHGWKSMLKPVVRGLGELYWSRIPCNTEESSDRAEYYYEPTPREAHALLAFGLNWTPMEVIAEEISEREIPVDAIYDEDELLENDMIQKMLEDEREALDSDGWAKVDEKDEEIEELEKKNAELERQLTEFREWNAKMKDNYNEEWCRRCGSWQNCERDGSDIIKDAKWGYVCHDCLHHLDNPDHERCKECDCCKDCDCCECEEENDDIVEGQIVDDEE